MKAVMTSSSSSSPYMKQVSVKEKDLRFLPFNSKDDLFAKSLFSLPLHHSCNNQKKKNVDLKLVISISSTRGGVLPVSISSSQPQAEVENHGLKIEESSDGYINEVDTESENRHEQTVRVVFQLQRECSFGHSFLIVGDDPMLGSWDPTNAVPLTWSDGHLWTVNLDIPTQKCIKFKFIMQEGNRKFIWQPGPDRLLEFQETNKIITICEDWENPDLRTIIEADPTFDQVEGSSATIEFAADEVMPVEPSVSSTNDVTNLKTSSTIDQTEEPEEYAINMKEMLESDEAVPVLVPGLSQVLMDDPKPEELVTEKALKDETEPMNGAAMVSAGADITNDLKLPELNSNPSIHENYQDSCEDQMQEVAEEQDSQPTESLVLNDGKNVFKKLLGIFGFE